MPLCHTQNLCKLNSCICSITIITGIFGMNKLKAFSRQLIQNRKYYNTAGFASMSHDCHLNRLKTRIVIILATLSGQALDKVDHQPIQRTTYLTALMSDSLSRYSWIHLARRMSQTRALLSLP